MVETNQSLPNFGIDPLIYMNSMPSTYEVQEIRNLVIQYRDLVAVLDAEITRLLATFSGQDQVVLDSFMARRSEALEQLQKYRSVVSPIQRLPQEILVEIFLRCRTTRKGGRYLPPRPQDAPLLICQVCSPWRQLARGTPILWRDMVFEFTQGRSSFELQEMWLARAGHASRLSISLIGRYSSVGSFVVLQSLDMAQYAHRIRELQLSNIFVMKLPHSFDVLESLELNSLQLLNSSPITEFQHAPRLRKVIFSRVHFDVQSIYLPWSQLTHLDVIHTCMDKFWEALSKCASLTHLILASYRVTPSARLVMQHLSHLHLFGSTVTWILDELTLPALEDFKASVEHIYDGSSLYRSFTLLQSRSAFRLKRLSLVGWTLSVSHFIQMMKENPSLLELTSISSVKVTTGLLSALTCRVPNEAHVTPNLKLLALHDQRVPSHPNDGESDFLDQEVADMVASRWSRTTNSVVMSGSSPLKVFSFHVESRALDEETTMRLQEFEARGLDLNLSRHIQI